MRVKKRRRDSAAQPASDAASGQRKKWRPVEMDLALMQEFESEGGFFIEEADEELVGVTRFDDIAAAAEADEPGQPQQPAGGAGRDSEKIPRGKRLRRRAQRAPEKSDKAAAAPAEPGRKAGAAGRAKAQQTQEQEKQQPAQEEVSPEVVAADLASWVPFDLHPLLMDGLWHLRFHKPTEVQARCLIPAILQRKDMVGAAETGSGKTLAFGLPILHHTLCAIDAAGEQPLATGQRSASSAVSQKLRALVVLPTRELAVQVQSHLNAVARRTVLHAECVVGGMSSQKQRRLLKRHPQIIVGTPGRLFALLGLDKEAEAERCDWFCEGLPGLRHLVLDEADRLVESGHFKELDSILALVYKSLERPQQLQTFVFSATLTLDPRNRAHRHGGAGSGSGSKVDALMERMQFREARAVHLVDLTRPEEGNGRAAASAGRPSAGAKAEPPAHSAPAVGAQLPERLLFREAVCSSDKDREALLTMWLLRRYRWEYMRVESGISAALGSAPAEAASIGGRVVLFVNAISSVLRLASVLAMVLESPSASKVLSRVRMSQSQGHGSKACVSVEVLGLHSKMRQKDRLKRMERFRGLDHAVLVCTDIAARGLDVPGVAAVVHYHAPRGAEVFVHRSGRTARAGREGQSVAFMGPGDATHWERIYRTVGIQRASVEDICPSAFELAAAREATRLAVTLESQLHRAAKKRSDASWIRRVADEAEIAVSDDDADPDAGRDAAPRRQLWGLYQQLLARVRRLPKRVGGAPLPRRYRRR